jgi:hypothetical protein
MNTEKKIVAVYKGIEICLGINGYYVFYLDNIKYHNTNIHMAKRMISKNLTQN